MKELEISIKQDSGMWRITVSCEANLANAGIIKNLFGCLREDNGVIRSGLLTPNVMKLISIQAELYESDLFTRTNSGRGPAICHGSGDSRTEYNGAYVVCSLIL